MWMRLLWVTATTPILVHASGPILYNVLATRHVNGGGDACALPTENYAVYYPFALGSIPELDYLKFRPDLCGHVVQIDCGHGPLDIVITNSNYGGGMDLYSQATWPIATNGADPGQVWCSVFLTDRNPLNGGSNRCFYKPTTGGNPYYRNVGLLNTEGRVVKSATLGGGEGAHRGDNPYFAFDQGRPIEEHEEVTFFFEDGGSHIVRLGDCVDVGSEMFWQ